jgi:peptidoglycan/LPS O-acetylase OafA/YrhL
MHKNNFDFLRLLFAVFVVFSHSYALSGAGDGDWLFSMSQQTTFSYIGVRCFFIISGFLIFESLLRSNGLKDYFWKRILRLFPALFVMLLVTLFILPLVYESSTPYLKNIEVWTYFPRNLSLYDLQYSIEGVFHNNPRQTINGSLWTIAYEFSLYILISFLFFIKEKRLIIRFILVVGFLFFSLSYLLTLNVPLKIGRVNFHGNFFNFSSFFLSGAIFASFKDILNRYKKFLLIFGIAALLLSFYFSLFDIVQFFLLPIIILPFGTSSTKYITNLSKKFGDMSYGIYIYSFPIQQIFVHLFNFSTFQLLIPSLLFSFLFAFASWHLIEKKALKFKQINFKLISFAT